MEAKARLLQRSSDEYMLDTNACIREREMGGKEHQERSRKSLLSIALRSLPSAGRCADIFRRESVAYSSDVDF